MIPEVYYKFLRRWFHVLLIGLLVGAGLGYTYRALSPIEAKAVVGPVQWEWPLKFGGSSESGLSFRLAGANEPRPPLYAGSSQVYIKGSLPSWTYLDPKLAPTTAQQITALAVKATSPTTLEAVSRELPDSMPYGPDELSQMVRASPVPAASTLRITVIGPSKEDIAQTTARVLLNRILAEEEQLAQDRKNSLEAQLQDIKRQQDAVQEERLALLKEPVETAQANLITYGEDNLAEMLKATAEVVDTLSPLSAERLDTEKQLRTVLAQLKTLQDTQSKAISSQIDKQLNLLAGVADSDEYIKLDTKIASLRAQLRTIATTIASLEQKALGQNAEDAVNTQARMDSLNAQLQTVRDQLDLATGERDRMVAQARDRVQIDIQSLEETQQAERAGTEKMLQAVLDQLKTLQVTQSKEFSSEVNKQLNLLAGMGDSDEYIKLDSKIAFLRAQLRTVATTIASLELEALGQNMEDRAKTQVKIYTMNEQFQTVRGQLDLAKEQRDQMVAQARDSIQVDLQSAQEAQQAERADTVRMLQAVLNQLQTAQATQSKDFSSEINKQLNLLAGVGDSNEYVELDRKIESLQTQLSTVLTNIASLETEALDAAMTQARIDSLNAEFQTVKDQLDLAKGQRDQMVAQARDTISLSVEPFQEAQQAQLAQALESAVELLGPLPAARTDAEAKLLAALTSLQNLEDTQRASIDKAIAQETNRLADIRQDEDYLIVQAKAASLQKQFGALTSSIASQELLDFTSTQRYLSTGEPTEPQGYTPPPPMRKRDSLVYGGGAGLVLAWLAAGFIDFRRNSRHQTSGPAEQGPGQGSPRGTGRVRGWLASLRRRGPDTRPSVLRGPALGRKSHQKGNS
ncbi:MAG: hypothetical protein ABIG98_01175 [Chloroflexota bacterium]